MTLSCRSPFLAATGGLAAATWQFAPATAAFVEAAGLPLAFAPVASQRSISKFLGSCLQTYASSAALPQDPHCAVVVSTNLGCLDEARDFLGIIYGKGFQFASAMRFPHTVNSSVIGAAARQLKISHDTILLIGENPLSFGQDLLAAEPELQSCLCVAVDVSRAGEQSSQYCAAIELGRARLGRRLLFASASWAADNAAAMRNLLQAAAARSPAAPVLLYASAEEPGSLADSLGGLSDSFSSIHFLQVSRDQASNSVLVPMLVSAADMLAPDRNIVVAHRNHLASLDTLTLSKRSA